MTPHGTGTGQLRMGDLVRLTGVPKETIHFYLREGLLPPANKTARNMGWYSDQHVHTLGVIRDLQEQHLLPLKAIKALLHDHDNYDFTPTQRALIGRIRQQRLADLLAASQPGQVSVAALAKKIGLPAQEVATLRETGMISSDDEDVPDPAEAEVLQLWQAIRSTGLGPARGLSPHDMRFITHAVDCLFDAEVQLFKEKLSSLDDDEIAPLLHVVLPAVNRLFALRHERKINALLEAFAGGQSPLMPAQEKQNG
ncbi:MAG: MerR family transcriptional regulator [Moraxellaceae bacterium]|nr:MerR family transcriptional regulator [Moraxellaceae bacterium]